MTKPHTGLPVQGYQAQSSEAVDAVNRNKVLEEVALRAIERAGEELPGIDGRALALAKTSIQEGFMWFNRAIFQPKRLEGDLPIDVSLYFDEGVTYDHEEHGRLMLYPFDGTKSSAEFISKKHSSVVTFYDDDNDTWRATVSCIDGGSHVEMKIGDYLGIARSGRAIALPKETLQLP